jgi:hypothetical protein
MNYQKKEWSKIFERSDERGVKIKTKLFDWEGMVGVSDSLVAWFCGCVGVCLQLHCIACR